MRRWKRDGLASLLEDIRYELVPLKGVDHAGEALRSGTTVTVTCSPKRGQSQTVDVVARLAAKGLEVVPHIAARQIRDEAELKEIVDRLHNAGVEDVFVIGGDRSEGMGQYTSALDLLEAMVGIDHPFVRVGVAGYPEGHYAIDEEMLVKVLLAKQPYATYMVSQLCFDAGVICRWLSDVRGRGVALPCYVGVPGPVDMGKLLRVSMRVGVGDSLRFLRGNRSTALGLFRVSGYRPGTLLHGLAAGMHEGSCDFVGLHLYTFNQTERTARWIAKVRRHSRGDNQVLPNRPAAWQSLSR